MCGIVGYVGPDPALPIVIEGLRRLEYRGYDSAGVAMVDGGLTVLKRAGKLTAMNPVQIATEAAAANLALRKRANWW